MDIETLGTAQLAQLVRDKQISSRELVDRAIGRIEAVNPTLNALIVDRFELARKEAAAADDALANGRADGPLWGLPCTVKETFALAGYRQTGGSVYHLDRRPNEDADVVKRLRRAGAIFLGLTNVPEMALWMETHNVPLGTTANPYDPNRTSGGSSGGEAALLSAGATALAVGSDIGGSIRIPAAFCGLFGHKPSANLVSLRGHFPAAKGKIDGIAVAGPMARRAEDLELVMHVLADAPTPPQPARADMLAGRTLLYYDTLGGPFLSPAGASVRAAIGRARQALTARGMRCEPFTHPALALSPLLHAATIHTSGGQSLESSVAKDGQRISLLSELGQLLLGRPNHTPEVLFVVGLERSMSLPGTPTRLLLDLARKVDRALSERLDRGDLLLCPPHPRVAPPHRWPLRRPFDWAYTGIFNALRMPATVVPAGADEGGLPLSVQLVGARGQDHLTLSAALALQEDLGGFVAPPPLAAC